MTADQIGSLQPALAALLAGFRPCFRRESTFDHWERYLLGLMADLKRKSIVERINKASGMGLSASDAFLLAKLPADDGAQLPTEQRQAIERFRRGDWYRFCLTPYFLEWEGDYEQV